MNEKNLVVKSTYNLAKVDEVSKMAKVLQDHIVKNRLYTDIVNKKYVHVEGWQFAGGLLGLYPRVVEVNNISNKDEVKWEAKVEIFNPNTDKVMGIGFAVCSNKEGKKKTFDEYAVLSMAQTRAIGKAYRNLLGWVMKLAGYEATPAEEMKDDKKKEEIAVEVGDTLDYELGLIDLGAKNGAPAGKEIDFIEKKVGHKIDWKKMNSKSYATLCALFRSRVIKNSK